MPKVSVIVPTYNRGNLVTKALDSILAQDFKDYEIIVVDDGSTDNTAEVLKSYIDKITCIRQKNSGVSSARNTGIRAAKGEWVSFLDSDDEWLPNYLSCQMEHVKVNPDVSTHITNSIQISSNGDRINSFQKSIHSRCNILGDSLSLILQRPFCFVMDFNVYNFCLYLQATIIKRDTLLKAGLFNTQLTISEDIDLIARMSLEGPLGIHDKPLVHIYRRTESKSNLTDLKKNRFDSLEYLNRIYRDLYSNRNLSLNEKRFLKPILSSNLRSTANLLLKTGDISKARNYYCNAFLANPCLKSLGKYLLSFSPKVALSFVRKESIGESNARR